jgi:hypothetical protein
VVLDNGSGLSRSERIRPRQLARALQAALAGRHASELLTSLPVAGVDGTMRNRLKDSPAAGWARLKTARCATCARWPAWCPMRGAAPGWWWPSSTTSARARRRGARRPGGLGGARPAAAGLAP